MATIRRPAKPKTNYALISNDWLRDASLDWEARGLLAWLATHEHGFTVSVDDIVAAGTAGRDAVRRMLRKLVAAGYLLCRQVRDSAGKLRHALWQLSDPAGAKAQVKPSTGNPGHGFLIPLRRQEKTKNLQRACARRPAGGHAPCQGRSKKLTASGHCQG